MLKIINNLQPFFEDCYRRINVREYAKIMKISPPTASRMLQMYHKEGLVLKEIYKNYLLFYANKDSPIFIDVSRVYWRYQLKKLVLFIEEKRTSPTIILFGSLSKAEAKPDSDVDLVVFAPKRELDMEPFEKKIKRKVQLFWYSSLNDIKNKELANNILNGVVLKGRLRL